jgi:signal transduction histidine kinase
MNTKHELSDKELIAELQRRFDKNQEMLEAERELIKQLNEVNQKLVESEKVKTNFLSNIRNEINNPIASILELSKNLSLGVVPVDMQQQCAEMIHSEAFELDFQLRNIFISAELEAGEAPLSVISVDVRSLIDSVIESFIRKITKKNLILKVEHGMEEGTIFRSDAEKLHLILSNLLSNAIQFNNEGGSILIRTSVENGILHVSIQDSGIGIAPEDQKEIYNRFHQVEAGSTKSFGGHGLGLSVTKALLEIINGTIHVESAAGSGSTFTICVNQMEGAMNEDVFSSDGNDFLFDSADDDMLF